MKINHGNTHKVAADFVVKTRGVQETLDFGRKLGRILKSGDVVALVGGLGAGKTWLAKGIAFELGVPEYEVSSPAFDLVHEYLGDLPVYHMDFYRLDELPPEDYLWLEEYLNSEGVCIIEWADRFIDQLAENHLRVELFVNGEDEREIRITAVGEGYRKITEGLRQR